MDEITLDDVIRELERYNFKHVNDIEDHIGELSENYCDAISDMIIEFKKLNPNFVWRRHKKS